MDENMQNSNNMGKIIAVLLVIILLVAGVYSAMNWNKNDVVDNLPIPGSDYYVSVINVKHQYKDGKHIYAGSLDLPTPCYSLVSAISKDTETSATITLDTSRNEEEICSQVITNRKFKVETTGGNPMSIQGLMNSKPIQLNLFEVPADKNIDEVEIDIKG